MDSWREVVWLIMCSLGIAVVAALVICIPIYLIFRGFHTIPRFRKQHTWQTDIRPVAEIGVVVLVGAFALCIFVGFVFSGGCGTSDATEVLSPDHQHKIVVYNFDCGATTAFSLDVSLLRGDERLPKHNTAPLLYDHYRQFPEATGPQKNFDVVWSDPSHVTVRIKGLAGPPTITTQDGVSIHLEPLP